MAKKLKKLLHKRKLIKKEEPKEEVETEDVENSLFFTINHQLIPPYNVLLDTSFINHSVKRKLDISYELIKCLSAGIVMHVTDCVIGELEKLGRIYKIALNIVKDKSVKRLTCDHKGTYADDCIVERITLHRCYIVATCDTELKCRIRRVPGVPIVYVKGHKYDVEKLPKAVIKDM
ncbi:rRNA-processing protein fcf1 [Binucleata daphniae]